MDIREWIPTRSDLSRFWPSPYRFRIGTLRILSVFMLLAVIAVGVGIGLQLLGIYVVIPQRVELTNLLSIFGSLILSAALVYLYYQQKKLLSVEHRSRLGVNRILDADDDVIKIQVSNSGSGSVYGIFLKVKVEFNDGEIVGSENLLGLRADDDGGSRGFMKPYESETVFAKRLLLPMQFPDEDDQRIVPFGMAMSFAEDYNVTEGHLTLTVVWEDAIQTGEIEIFDEDFDVVRGRSFEEFIRLYMI